MRGQVFAAILGIDPGARSGAAVYVSAPDGGLRWHAPIKDAPNARDEAMRRLVETASSHHISGESLPIVTVIEKFGAGVGAAGHFGARTLAGIERRVGAWRDAALRVEVPSSLILRVLPQTWRARVLGIGSGPRETMQAVTRHYIMRRFDLLEAPSDDECAAICIALWASTSDQVQERLAEWDNRRLKEGEHRTRCALYTDPERGECDCRRRGKR